MVPLKIAIRAVLLALALFAACASQAQNFAPPDEGVPPADPSAELRWKADLAAFAAADKSQQPGDGGVLFVGSSSIRLWNSMAQDFRQLPLVINRGFGGSTMRDCSLFARELVVRYKPRQVFVYAGDNDLAEGRTPIQVLNSFAHFVNTVRASLPKVRIAYISVKPSPARERLLPQIRETNHVIAAYLQRLPNSDYVDIFTPMLDASGRPRVELFRGDRLHLNRDGYRLWHSVIASHLPALDVASPATLAEAPR